MNLRAYLSLLGRKWRVFATCLGVGLLLSAIAYAFVPRDYSSHLRFYVTSPGAANAGASTNFAQAKLPSLMRLASSELAGQRVLSADNVGLSADEVAKRVEASTEVSTVMLVVDVTDTSPQRAERIAKAMSATFPKLASDLENSTSGKHIQLNLVDGPTAAQQVAPKLRTYLLAGSGGGLLVALGWVWVGKLLDTAIRTRTDLRQAISAEVIGETELLADRAANVLIDAPRSAAAEDLRRLRANVSFGSVDGEPGTDRRRVVAVTSAEAGEGKTTLVAGLGQAFAETGERVVLVDADLRRRGLAPSLGLSECPGLAEVLAQPDTLDDALQHWAGVFVLAAGATSDNPAALLASAELRDLVARLAMRFDRVLVDTAPVLPCADATAVAALSDAVVLVARAAVSQRADLRAAEDVLRGVDAPLLGTVLTARPRKRADRRPDSSTP